jgi:hypothetical protein
MGGAATIPANRKTTHRRINSALPVAALAAPEAAAMHNYLHTALRNHLSGTDLPFVVRAIYRDDFNSSFV